MWSRNNALRVVPVWYLGRAVVEYVPGSTVGAYQGSRSAEAGAVIVFTGHHDIQSFSSSPHSVRSLCLAVNLPRVRIEDP